MPGACAHINAITNVRQPEELQCDACVKIGARWQHLRTCQTCGTTLCCDSSPNKHATKHFHATKHPIMRSMEPGEDWGWCYADELFLVQR